MKVIVECDFVEGLSANIEFDYPKQVEACIDVAILNSLTNVPEDTVRFFITTQPEGVYNKVIKENQNCYNYLLTAFDDLLELPNSHLFIGCGAFVDPNPNIPKKFGVSTIMSGRNCLPGHKVRRELYARRHEIKIPFDFYLGTHNILPEEFYTDDCIKLSGEKKEKTKAFDCMFHIAIDSYKRKNHYSEKLVDALVTKTVPIYWGCTNIGDYFNKAGILEINSVDDIIWCCNNLTPEDYEMFTPFVEENYNRGVEESNYGKILERRIKECLL